MKIRTYVLKNHNLARLQRRDQAWEAVMRVLQERPRADYKELAEALDWPLKKAKGHMDRMKKAGKIELIHQWQVKSDEHRAQNGEKDKID